MGPQMVPAREGQASAKSEGRRSIVTVAKGARRRVKGNGSLRSLGGGRYRFQIEAPDGKALSRVFTAANDTDANVKAGPLRVELLAKHQAAKDADGAERAVRQSWTVERYCDYYLSTWAPLHLADTTRARRRTIFARQVVPHIGRKRIGEVTPDDLASMYAALEKSAARKRNGRKRDEGTLAGSTVVTVHTAVRALFSFAKEIKGDVPANPAASKAARPKVDATPKRYAALSFQEVEAIVAAAAEREPRIAVGVMLSAYLGTRRGETVALRWEDVDFQARTIRVRRSVTWTAADGLRVKSTKTGKERTIPLDAHTLSELKRIQQEQRKQRLRFGAGWRGAKTPDGDHICAETDGAVMNPAVLGVLFQRLWKHTAKADAAQRAHDEPQKRESVRLSATLHQLRHSWVSQQIALGYDAVTIAAMSGHSPDVLLRVYAHAFDARKREAMDAMAEARKAARDALKAV
jgi:integrase